jgi:type I restriction enzyme S subunit
MTGRYQAYSEYQKSDIDFVKQLPKDWKETKIRFEFSFGKGLPITKANLQEKGIPVVNYGEIHSKFGFEVDPQKHRLKCVDESYLKSSPSSLLNKGDIIFADTSEDIEGSGNFTQLVSEEKVFAGYHTVIARPKKEHCSRYLAYLLNSAEYRSQVQNTVKGVKVFTISQGILKGTNIWLPSDKEQQKIAEFLDYETVKIDLLITKQKKLITLLKEKHQADISHTVTKGLNPKSLMKDSGISWLGKVPKHWKQVKLKHITEQIIDAEHKTAPYHDNEKFLVCRTTNIRNGSLRLKGAKYTDESTYKQWIKRGKPQKGDILFTREAPAGEACVYDGEIPLCLGQRMVLFRLNKKRLLPEFVLNSIYSGLSDEFVQGLSQGTTVAHFNMSDIRNIPMFEPPYEEQNLISEYLNNQNRKYQALSQLAQNKINLLQEHRVALISAAITGKIDVRNWSVSKELNK